MGLKDFKSRFTGGWTHCEGNPDNFDFHGRTGFCPSFFLLFPFLLWLTMDYFLSLLSSFSHHLELIELNYMLLLV